MGVARVGGLIIHRSSVQQTSSPTAGMVWEWDVTSHHQIPGLQRLRWLRRSARGPVDVYADLFDTDLDAVAVELDAVIRAIAGQC